MSAGPENSGLAGATGATPSRGAPQVGWSTAPDPRESRRYLIGLVLTLAVSAVAVLAVHLGSQAGKGSADTDRGKRERDVMIADIAPDAANTGRIPQGRRLDLDPEAAHAFFDRFPMLQGMSGWQMPQLHIRAGTSPQAIAGRWLSDLRDGGWIDDHHELIEMRRSAGDNPDRPDTVTFFYVVRAYADLLRQHPTQYVYRMVFRTPRSMLALLDEAIEWLAQRDMSGIAERVARLQAQREELLANPSYVLLETTTLDPRDPDYKTAFTLLRARD